MIPDLWASMIAAALITSPEWVMALGCCLGAWIEANERRQRSKKPDPAPLPRAIIRR